MKIEDIIMILDNASKLKDGVQDRLVKFVHDKSIPLEERKRVYWTHCNPPIEEPI